MSRPKILHCITDLSPDGAQRLLLRLIDGFPPGEFDSLVVTLAGGGHLVDRFKEAGIEVRSLGMKRGIPGISGLLRLRAEIRAFRPDVIQGWMYHGNLAALLGARISGSRARVYWNIRRCLYKISSDKPLTRLVMRIGARVSKAVDGIVYCVSMAAPQHEALGFDPAKRIVIPNGYDFTRFTPTLEHREAFRAELGLPAETMLVGIAGRYHFQKDYPNFLRAAARLAALRPDVQFVMVGRGVDSANPEISKLVEELGIASRLHLLGERQDLSRIYTALDIFCSSSENEGFSNVVAEATACGIPCVVTDVGASREIVEDNGTIVSPWDDRALAAGIFAMLTLSPEKRRELGLRARNRLIERFSLRTMLDAYASLYRGDSGAAAEKLERAA